jgi:hypothetical protein
MFDRVEIKTYKASAYTQFSRSPLNRAPAELEDFMTKLFSVSIRRSSPARVRIRKVDPISFRRQPRSGET